MYNCSSGSCETHSAHRRGDKSMLCQRRVCHYGRHRKRLKLPVSLISYWRCQEMFIRYLAEQALKVSKTDRKPRRNIQYKDLGMNPQSDANLSSANLAYKSQRCGSHRQSRVPVRCNTSHHNFQGIQGQEIKTYRAVAKRSDDSQHFQKLATTSSGDQRFRW